MSERISLADPVLGEAEKEALARVIDEGWLTMGDRVKSLEDAFARLHGVEGAVAVSSCTAGLHLCLAALDIGPGDEVLLPSLTFVATANTVLYAGARPVFVDIQRMDLPHLSMEDARAKLTSRTRGVIVMHYGGYPVDLPGWRAFADAHGLKLVEDAAHAPGVGEVGRWGDAAAFSFFANKNMTTAEGGMVLARDPVVLQDIRFMRAHGMTTGTLDRHRGHAHSYDVTMLGYNYRMDELRAALGLEQIRRLGQWNARRRKLAGYYRRVLGQALPVVIVPFQDGQETAAHLMAVLLPADAARERVMDQLREAGIQSSIHYPPVHQFSYYRDRFGPVCLPLTEGFSKRELTLPLHPSLTEAQVERVVGTLQRALEKS